MEKENLEKKLRKLLEPHESDGFPLTKNSIKIITQKNIIKIFEHLLSTKKVSGERPIYPKKPQKGTFFYKKEMENYIGMKFERDYSPSIYESIANYLENKLKE